MSTFFALSVALILGIVSVASDLPAEPKVDAALRRDGASSPRSYCGVYCVLAAAKSLRTDLSAADFIRPRFISSPRGSTRDDLLAAIDFAGFSALETVNCPIERLGTGSGPVIVHTRSVGPSSKFEHWMLVYGRTASGKLKIYDPPNYTTELSIAEFLSIWDGYAIEVRAREDSQLFFSWRPAMSWQLASVVLLTLAVSFLLARSFVRFRWMVPAILAVCVVLVTQLTPQSFIRNPESLNYVLNLFDSQEISTVPVEEVLQLENKLFVDARTSLHYRAGHIEGAVSLPIDASLLQIKQFARSVDPRCTCVVYCNNANCGWAAIVGEQLVRDGVKNVKILEGGLIRWNQDQEHDHKTIVGKD